MGLNNKKAIYYSLDALLAGILLVAVAAVLLNLSFYEPEIKQKSYMTQDILNILSELQVGELNNSFVLDEINNGNITDLDNSVLDQIGIYWALNETNKSQQLFLAVFNETLSDTKNVQFSLESDTIFLKNDSTPVDLVTGRRMISGVTKGEAVTGSSSSGYLKKVRNKKTASYAYFGGFVGQGNISVKLFLPDDISSSRIEFVDLILETPGNFSLILNDDVCGGGNFIGEDGNVSYWDITTCKSSFDGGENNISLHFDSSLNNSYVAGGFLRIIHTTDVIRDASSYGYKRYYFPDVNGFINIYDSISAQGIIQNWSANITVYNEYDTFLTFENETILVLPGSNTTQNVIYSETNQNILPKQIPIRLGTTNLSNITIVNDGTPADSFLITDVSGSMDTCGLYYDYDELYCSYEYYWTFLWFSGWAYTECIHPGTCVSNECGGTSTTRNHTEFNKTITDCDKTMLEVAQEADELFVDTILANSSSLNKIGLVDYSSNANTPTALTGFSGKSTLINEIATYNADGGTCTCCGINRARDILDSSTNKKFLVVLSDGEPTFYCSNIHDYIGSTSDDGDGSSMSTNDRNSAVAAAQEACDNNITVYAVGFGEGMSSQGHEVMKDIACNESLYFNATNISTLSQIYANISDSILVAANYSSQTISVVGNFTPANLYDSYIDIYYEPYDDLDLTGKISLTFESDQFGSCSDTVTIPQGVEVQDAFVTSFSSNHWTKSVSIDGSLVYNLSDYGSDYTLYGDPFTVQIPSLLLTSGDHLIELEIGDSPNNSSACSKNNSLIYLGLINASTGRSSAVESYSGCNWTIESENDHNFTILIPSSYNQSNTCEYTSGNVSYNDRDAYDIAAYQLLVQLDPDNNGRVLVDLSESDLEITVTLVTGVPYLWGPSVAKTNIWS